MNTTILIADDEERWRRIVGDFLRNEGYRVLEAADGQQAMELMRSEQKIDLVILDIMMPVLDGLETCQRIRRFSSVPVMIVTARDAEADEVHGFHCGADEFIAKPLRFPVFMARVKALLKRTSTVTVTAAGRIEINTASHTVQADGRVVNLTPREYELLLYLMQHRGSARSRQQILQDVWKNVHFGEARMVDTHIKNLRMKLGSCGIQLKTVRGSGYMLEA